MKLVGSIAETYDIGAIYSQRELSSLLRVLALDGAQAVGIPKGVKAIADDFHKALFIVP